MKDVLEEIVAWKAVEVEEFKRHLPERQLHDIVEQKLNTPCVSMKNALISSTSGIIAEFKRKSPSKGWIKESGKADEIPLSYQINGAAALSILTDMKYFGGHDDFIKTARTSGVTIPILYKNFIIDEYQLFMARNAGASAVLLIAACLSYDRCKALIHTAHELGMEVVLEMHSEQEIEYARLSPDMCGINNRNLGTFITDIENSFNLVDKLPTDAVKVSESGISNPDTVKLLRYKGFNGFLIGENFMKSENPGQSLKCFINEIV